MHMVPEQVVKLCYWQVICNMDLVAIRHYALPLLIIIFNYYIVVFIAFLLTYKEL